MGSKLICEGSIFQESKILHEKKGKAIFKMILQDTDTPNQNKRIYPKLVLENSLRDCNERMNRKSFFGEMDHPLPKGDDRVDSVRQTVVSLERVSHYIRDYEFVGNQMIGECETASTPLGQTLYSLIQDKCGIGMSMRGLAELERNNEYSIVKDPLVIIAYDSVSLPSHKSAVVDFNKMRFESKDFFSDNIITENTGTVCFNGRCFLPNYFDKLVETRMLKFFDVWE